MNLVYFDPYPNKRLEEYIKKYGELLRHNGEAPVFCKRVDTVEEVLKESDVSGEVWGHHTSAAQKKGSGGGAGCA